MQHSGVFTTGVVYFSRSPDTANANQTRAQSIINTLSEDPGQNPSTNPLTSPESTDQRQNATTELEPVTYRPTARPSDAVTEFSLHVPIRAAVSQPAPFTLPKHLTTEKPVYFHYITKSSGLSLNTTEEDTIKKDNKSTIIPTTYAPSKFFLKSILPRPITASTISESPIFSFNTLNITDNGVVVVSKPKHAVHKPHKTVMTIRKLNNTANTAEEPPTDNDTNKKVVSSVHFGTGNRDDKPISYRHSTLVKTKLVNKEPLITSTTKLSTSSSTTTTTTTTIATTIPTETTTNLATVTTPLAIDEEHISERVISQYITEKHRHYLEPNENNFYEKDEKRFRNTVEIPPAHELIYEPEDVPKPEPDQPPVYKPKPILKLTTPSDVTKTVADAPRTTAIPARNSRVNAAIKSLIAFGGTRRPYMKCYDTPNVKCNDLKQRYLFLQ